MSKSTPKQPKESYEVIVFDLYDDDSETYISGFPTFEQAREYARRRIRDSLEEQRPGSKDAKDLKERWFMFGEDCSVVPGDYESEKDIDFFIANPASPEERDWESLKPGSKSARSMRPKLAGAARPLKPVSQENIRSTLTLCPPNAQAIFNRLISDWMAAGGKVQAIRPGRIYLRLKTKAHSSGDFARLSHNFNLLVLAAPKGKVPAHIQVQWNLSRYKYGAYLDCIPGAVEVFEQTAMQLPGFVRKKALSRVFLHDGFSLGDAENLSKAAIALKTAEESAP